MSKINLLFVITKLELGGAQKQLLALIGGLDKEKFRIFLFTAEDGLLMPDALSVPGLTLKKTKWLERQISPLKDILTLLQLRRFIRQNDIKIIHTHSSKAGILGRLAGGAAGGKVIIHTVHGWSFNDYQNPLGRLVFIWLERFAAKFTDKIIIVSNYDKQKGLANRIGKDSQYALIRYGIDYGEFSLKEENIRRQLGIGAGDFVVGMVACFKPQKNPLDFVKLAYLSQDTLPRLKFILVGDGILRRKIERTVRRFGLEKKIFLLGWRRDIPGILAAMDVFVLTSLWEGLPISVLEAMSSAKSVIATNTGGIREAIREGETGFLVKPKDTAAMLNRLAILANNASLRSKMGSDAAQSLEHDFSVAGMVKSTQDLYLYLIQKKELAHAN